MPLSVAVEIKLVINLYLFLIFSIACLYLFVSGVAMVDS